MELTADILKNKLSDKMDEKTILDIKSLHLSECTLTMSNGKFLAMTKSKTWLIPMTNFINKLFYINSHPDLPNAILFAFYLSGYHKEIFLTRCTKFDNKILYYANVIIMHISYIITDCMIKDNEFLDVVDHYYSLYKIWVGNDTIKQVDNKLINFKNTLDTYHTLGKLNEYSSNNTMIPALKKHMNDIFCINKMIGLKVFLQYYNQFRTISVIKTFFWDKITTIYDNNTNHTFILLVAELRKCLIQSTSTTESKKKLYYNIDIDELIKKARNDNIIEQDYIDILNILSEYLNMVNLSESYDDDIDKIQHNDFLNKIIVMYDTL